MTTVILRARWRDVARLDTELEPPHRQSREPAGARRPEWRSIVGTDCLGQAKRVMWNPLKRNIPEDWIQGRPNNTECVMQMRTGHVMRVVGFDDPDALRGSGLWFFLGDEGDDAKAVILPMMASLRCASSKISATPRPAHYSLYFKPFFKQAA
jgi:hypothetical protein